MFLLKNLFIGLLVFALLIICMLFPRTANRKKLLDRFKGTHFAHRGYHCIEKGVPENSIPAFENAIANGYGIELDVHLTKDQRLVVFHDDTLDRICGKDGTVEAHTATELSTCRLSGTKEKIPLFEDVLSLVDGKVPLLIELKIPGRSTAICRHVQEMLAHYKGDYMVQSFNTMGLIWYRLHAPKVLRGQLSSRLTKDDLKESFLLRFLVENLLLNFLGRPDFISYKLKDLPKYSVRFLISFLRTPTAVWTLQTPEALQKGICKFDMQIFEKHSEIY